MKIPVTVDILIQMKNKFNEVKENTKNYKEAIEILSTEFTQIEFFWFSRLCTATVPTFDPENVAQKFKAPLSWCISNNIEIEDVELFNSIHAGKELSRVAAMYE